jgi:RNA polymerase sigma-70 factor (ECF subfamily)
MREGDVDALDNLTRCFGERMLAVGRRYCGDDDLARDAVQDTMLAAGQHLTDFRADGSLEGWLVRMVGNFCRRMHRGQKNDPGLHVGLESIADSAGVRDGSPEEQAARGELLKVLGNALLGLDPRDRVLLVLSDAEDWRAPEIAKSLNMTAAAVRTRLSRARKALRAELGAFDELWT